MTTSENALGRTGVYVDGYNLYYGRLRGTDFKWLDLVKLVEDILSQRDQNERLEGVHLFTAHALAKFAGHGKDSVEAQSAYHRALQAKHGERLTVTYGKHAFDRDGSLLPEFVAGQPYDRTKRTRVWRLEEKKTDVNLAICMYRHAVQKRYDRIILISNDSDAEPALEAIREDFPHIVVGVIVPIRPPALGGETNRRVSGSLALHADWVVKHLTDAQLQAAQLPAQVPTNKKPIRKPTHWGPAP
ncbi:NYN domain-containing protein [Hydrogenophaga pseudoflava]|uniref:6-hydroxy-3-succinoylpyridine 3-monooxygenase HspA n=1 Tax=Hydrogenophaga pseudoflava TaxID=47421 RepID=A0A4P6X7A7_HYDPS|nr:NYN domain-containing protein [Hydrogenophaga pseudoflava]QBM30616.1 6-hydroxy-3-succinoylpyridine 3-monooxygenase HspA [Hydrogenophaga pseudoflava]